MNHGDNANEGGNELGLDLEFGNLALGREIETGHESEHGSDNESEKEEWKNLYGSGQVGYGTNFNVHGERRDDNGWCNICHEIVEDGKLYKIIRHQAVHYRDYGKRLSTCENCHRLFMSKAQMREHRDSAGCLHNDFASCSSSKRNQKKKSRK